MLTVVLALVSSLFYGVSDFLGGLGVMRLRVIPGTAVTYLFGAVTLGIALPIVGGTWSSDALFWGFLTGVFAIVGFISFYAALAVGPMSLVSPLVAVLGAVVPVLVAALRGERLEFLAWIAIVIALISAALIAITPEKAESAASVKTIVLSVVSGVTLGMSLVALDGAPDDAGVIPALVEMVVGVAVLAVLATVSFLVPGIRVLIARLDDDAEPAATSRRTAVVLGAVAGVLLAAANAVLLVALRSGSLAVVSVLIGLYPLATMLLARIVFRERLRAVQYGGVALALVASAMLALS
jgi:drug/metabolite transporter (DMT)-like permease